LLVVFLIMKCQHPPRPSPRPGPPPSNILFTNFPQRSSFWKFLIVWVAGCSSLNRSFLDKNWPFPTKRLLSRKERQYRENPKSVSEKLDKCIGKIWFLSEVSDVAEKSNHCSGKIRLARQRNSVGKFHHPPVAALRRETNQSNQIKYLFIQKALSFWQPRLYGT
jgi:hypothetical protein